MGKSKGAKRDLNLLNTKNINSCRYSKGGNALEKQNKFEKLTDKAFSRLIVTSMLGIFISIISLCSVTWAWFSQDITVPSNTIKAGYYEANLSVANVTYSTSVTADNKTVTVQNESPIDADTSVQGFYRYMFDGNSVYKVNIPYTANGSNGYCKIHIEGLTAPLFANISSNDSEFDFLIKLSSAAEVRFELRWGTHSGENAVADGELLEVTIPGDQAEKPAEEPQPVETEPVETQPVETEPVETEPVETQPVETEPVETEPVETQPVETEPVETEPVETEPVETEPVEINNDASEASETNE